MSNTIEFCIIGQCYSLKNSRKLITLKSSDVRAIGVTCQRCGHKNHVIHVPGDKAAAFDRAFKKQLPESAKQNLVTAVYVDIEIFYPSNLQDVDEAIVLDCMQRYHVIENDRQVVAKYVVKRIDPNNPRVVVKVTPVAWDRTGQQPRLLDDVAVQPEIREAV